MKKILGFALILIVIIFAGCATSSGQRQAANVSFSDIAEKEWKLTEVWINGKNSGFTRNALGFGEAFTLTFGSDMVSGVGAPNRYSAPYSLGQERAITIQMVRSTLMAAIFETQALKEHDFFNYIQNVNKWNLAGNKLELLSKNTSGETVLLVFN